MTLRVDDIQLYSNLPGLGNYDNNNTSMSVPAHSLGAFGSSTTSVNVTLNRSDILLSIQTRYSLETIWRPIGSYHIVYKPSFAAADYTIITNTNISGDTLTISTTVANATAGAMNTPAFTVNIRVNMYTAPFSL